MPRSARQRQNKMETVSPRMEYEVRQSSRTQSVSEDSYSALTESISQSDQEVRKIMLKHTKLEQESSRLEKRLADSKEKIVENLADLRKAVTKMTALISKLETKFGVVTPVQTPDDPILRQLRY
ncbi:hypothetical protein HDU85_003702 [Gaertneriomyces sp. JEL0708]|nr:hypothetical protein HDU85_003702 [Gaertneriomyces sp. JEL0708]